MKPNRRGIWFIDTPEETDQFGDETTSLLHTFTARHTKGDLEALHEWLPQIAPRMSFAEQVLSRSAHLDAYDPRRDWLEMELYLELFRQMFIQVGCVLAWQQRLHISGDTYDPERIRKYLLSVPAGIAFLGWPEDSVIRVYGHANETEERTFRRKVRWGALLGRGDASGTEFDDLELPLPKGAPVYYETETSIADWLAQLGLSEYLSALESNHVDMKLLRTLSDSDLRELGINSLGHRRSILQKLADEDARTNQRGP